jgi:photosystem II stability/assembly factor-like uncharacterized protein
MKIKSIHAIALLLLGFSISSCLREKSGHKPQDLLAEKNFPNEYFFMQRTWPDSKFSVKAYEQAMHEARTAAAVKSTGFDAEWTVQGPGNIGARANTIAVHPTDENIIYAGFSNGGVWKTTDGGASWAPIFDDQLWPAIGDIAIDPNDPETVYAGTGDPNITFYPMLGDGLYKSTDGGATWTNLGPMAPRIISKIILHPTKPGVIYVSTMGLPFERNNDRGLYKTSDGGATWQQVLFISNQAGITDVVMDPFDPNTLYASGWDRIRNNEESIVDGPGARVFKTTDGGDTWMQMTTGLPAEDMGRTSLAISSTNPGVVYVRFAGTDSQLAGIFKTENGGTNWNPIDITGLEDALGGFGWYFSRMAVNPLDDNELYILGVEIWHRDPATGLWESINPPWWQYIVHADKHDLVFSASNTMYLATDGGLYKTADNGANWEDIEDIPTTQFYRVAYNPHAPDLYYGGAQDNGTTGGNAASFGEWERIYGGDGFQPLFHPGDPQVFYVETQNGSISVTDDGGYSWYGATDGISGSDRRNWDMPYIMSPHNPDVFYTGTFRVYKSTAGVYPYFEAISEDLTDGLILNPRYHNISTLSKSPILEGLLYVGTADGNVWRTDDDGTTWTEISAGLPDRYVTEVKASPEVQDRVYVSHSGYKDNEFIPRLHRSDDRGSIWEDISGNLPNLAINDLYVLPGHADSILFAATDGGIYGTLDSGESWERLGTNMPYVPSFDLEWNPVHNQLIAGTFARSIMTYPIDSLLYMEPPDTTTAVNPVFAGNTPVRIFPNPARDFITVEFSAPPGKATEAAILDVAGRLVLRRKITPKGNVSQKLDISRLPAGSYFIKIKTGSAIRSGSFVKQ